MKFALLVVLLFLLAGGRLHAQELKSDVSELFYAQSIDLPSIAVRVREGAGKDKVDTYCSLCHSTDYITMQPRFTKAQWTATVAKMIQTFGAPIGADDRDTIVQYLTSNYGTGN